MICFINLINISLKKIRKENSLKNVSTYNVFQNQLFERFTENKNNDIMDLKLKNTL